MSHISKTWKKTCLLCVTMPTSHCSFYLISMEYNKCCRSSYIKTVCALDCKNIHEISYKCKSNTHAVFPHEGLVPTLVLYDLYLPYTCHKGIINLCWREPLSVFTVCFIWKKCKNVNRGKRGTPYFCWSCANERKVTFSNRWQNSWYLYYTKIQKCHPWNMKYFFF